MKTLKKFGATAVFASVLVGGGSVAAAGSASAADHGPQWAEGLARGSNVWSSVMNNGYPYERHCGGRGIMCMSIY